jgi:GntR family transcriptional regulator of arabinose operon
MKEKSVPKYVQLKNEILSWLHAGRLRTDEQMPSENEIAELFQVSRQTVRQTFGELEKEGWLYRIQGKGTFVANPHAQSRTGVQTIGVVTTYISDYIFPHIVRGIEATLRDKGYRLMLSSTDNDKAKEREALAMMLSQPISGLIIEPTKSAEGNPNVDYFLSLTYHKLPFLMINERYPELDCPCLRTDDEAGAFLAATYVMDRGHQRVAGFFKTDDRQGVNRLKGFMRAYRDRGLALSPDFVVHYDTGGKQTKPQAAAAALLSREERPTAIVCYNDELAVQLLETIRQVNLRVPEDVSIVGFDDSPLATATEIKLTSVVHPKSRMGSDAADMLLRMIGGRSAAGEAEGYTYAPILIERNSVKML